MSPDEQWESKAATPSKLELIIGKKFIELRGVTSKPRVVTLDSLATGIPLTCIEAEVTSSFVRDRQSLFPRPLLDLPQQKSRPWCSQSSKASPSNDA